MSNHVFLMFGLFIFPYLASSPAFALDRDVERIDRMLQIPESFQRLELASQDRPNDSPNVKRKRQELRNSIATYKSVVAEIRQKYDTWIKNGYQADEIQEKIKNRRDAEYGKLALNYLELGFCELKGFVIGPRGEKGAVAENTEYFRLKGLQTGLEQQRNAVRDAIREASSADTAR